MTATTLDAGISERGCQHVSFCKKQSDDTFHLSPFAQLHENTIFPISTDIPPDLTGGSLQHHDVSNSKGSCSGSGEPGGMEGQDHQVRLISSNW